MVEATSDVDVRTLRKKMLGVKIRHARTRAGLGVDEVAMALGVPPEFMTNVELGQGDVSLPQLEVMAYLFNIPVVYFWSEQPLVKIDWNFPTHEAMGLRRRIIGVLLHEARTEVGRSEQELANLLGVPVDQIISYEYGQLEIPLEHLEKLADLLKVSLEYFLDEGIAPRRPGSQGATLDEIAQFSELPPDVREFLLNPANLLYLNIAMRLSGLSAETLRGLAEGLLEITY